MFENIGEIIREAAEQVIRETITEESVMKRLQRHKAKIHFIPIQYRVLSGLIQALNIKFGNFIERMIRLIIQRDAKVKPLLLSGKRVEFLMRNETDNLVDQYITSRQLLDCPDNCDKQFQNLLTNIIELESRVDGMKQMIVKDVDVLFQLLTGQIVYLEIKYADNHDTGKFVDINRKFIKTFAGLVNQLGIKQLGQLKPIIYYFDSTKRWPSIYTPDSNVRRGAELFDEYFETKFSDIDFHLRKFSDDENIVAIFDQVYKKVRYDQG